MAGVIDLEDEDLIDADENDLYNTLDPRDEDNEEDGLVAVDVDLERIANNEDDRVNPDDPPAADTSNRVAPKKRVVRNPQPKLNAERLKGPRGLMILEEWFKDVKYKGKHHEKEDLDAIMMRLEQWTNRLFPKFTFDDCIARIETLGHKKEVANYVRRIRLDMEHGFGGAVTSLDADDSDDQNDPRPLSPEADPFDSLLGEQPQMTSTQAIVSQPMTLTDEQRERMVRNRLLAEEKRLARAKERAEEQARKQREAEEIAEALAASQAFFEDDPFSNNADLENSVSQNDRATSIPNGYDEGMEIE